MCAFQLSPEQREAVENQGGTLLVSAAAGSGKTRVLVERLFRYVTEEKADVDDFLIITFTRAAAAELRGRIVEELNRRLAETPGDGHLRRQLLLGHPSLQTGFPHGIILHHCAPLSGSAATR